MTKRETAVLMSRTRRLLEGARQTPVTSESDLEKSGLHQSTAGETRRIDQRDIFVATGIAILAGALALWVGLMRSALSEDATMLFRYSEHLSAGLGIVWNVGEPPVDGATDFLFMVTLAGLNRLGISAPEGAAFINSIGIAGTSVLVYLAIARHSRGRVVPSVAACLVVLGPSLWYVREGFAAPIFAFVLAGAAACAVEISDGRALRWSWYLGSLIAIAGLVRPEGFLYGGLLLVYLVVTGRGAYVKAVWRAGIVGGVVAVLYVGARWQYFGYPFPNPYYRKGGGRLHFDGLLNSIQFGLLWMWPLLLVLGLGLLSPESRRRSVAVCAVLAGGLGMWVLISNEMNHLYRFQHPLYVMGLILCAGVLPGASRTLHRRPSLRPAVHVRGVFAGMSVAVLIGFSVAVGPGITLLSDSQQLPTAQERISTAMARFSSEGRLVVTTEAGYVCWKSGWRCIDAWGLNDIAIAHNGFLTADSLASLHPDVIVVHANSSPLSAGIGDESGFLDGWTDMSNVLVRYSESSGYLLSACFGVTESASYAVYVRLGASDAGGLTEAFAEQASAAGEPRVVGGHLAYR